MQPAANIQPVQTFEAELVKHKAKFGELLGVYVTPERFIRVAVAAYARTPALRDCTMSSILHCLVQCSELGLEPETPLGLAYLVPFQNKKTGKRECTLIIGYRGMVQISLRSGLVRHIDAFVVHVGDHFDIDYGVGSVSHQPKLDEPGEPVGVWARAELTQGGQLLEYMTWAEVMKIRRRSKAAEAGPWVTDTEEQARKTLIRRIWKRCPTMPGMDRAEEIDNTQYVPEPRLSLTEMRKALTLAAPATPQKPAAEKPVPTNQDAEPPEPEPLEPENF